MIFRKNESCISVFTKCYFIKTNEFISHLCSNGSYLRNNDLLLQNINSFLRLYSYLRNKMYHEIFISEYKTHFLRNIISIIRNVFRIYKRKIIHHYEIHFRFNKINLIITKTISFLRRFNS